MKYLLNFKRDFDMNKCIDCKEQTKSNLVECCICVNYLHSSCAKKDSGRFYCKKHWAVKHGKEIKSGKGPFPYYNCYLKRVLDHKSGLWMNVPRNMPQSMTGHRPNQYFFPPRFDVQGNYVDTIEI